MERKESLARWATLVLIAVATIRVCVAIVPQVRFDSDPAVDPSPYPGLGPTGSFVLDALLLIASGTAFLSEYRAGRRVITWLVVLAALPGISVMLHGWSQMSDLFRGATWLAAAFAGVAAAHLARDPAQRRLLIAGCAAVLVPLLMRGAEQRWIEHPVTVAKFLEEKARFFAERGWDPASAPARSFERRVTQAESSGWFGLANIFSAMMAFGTVFFAGFALARRQDRSLLLAALLACGCAAFVVLNFSKGAIVATACGAMVLAIGMTPRLARFAPAVAFATIALAAAAPALRGALPEDFGNERSLLFRAHYLEGALRAAPEAMPFGVGPDGLQNVYLRTKPARSPEDVISTHAMVVDWFVLLGPLGLAWVAVVARLLWRRPEREPAAVDRPRRDEGDERTWSSPLRASVMIACAILAVMALAEPAMLTPAWIVTRVVMLCGFIVVWIAVDHWVRQCVRQGGHVTATLLAALTAVLAQAQVEMIFFQPGMVVWTFVVLGSIAALPALAAMSAFGSRVSAVLAWSAALCIITVGAVPQFLQDRVVDRAIDEVAPLAELRETFDRARPEIAAGNADGTESRALLALVAELGGVESAAQLNIALRSTAPDRLDQIIAVLRHVDSGQRAKAADLLLEADAMAPTNWTPIDAAIKQLAAAGRRTVGMRTQAIIDPVLHNEAARVAYEAAERWRMPRFAARFADLLGERVRAAPDALVLKNAIEATNVALQLEPRSVARTADLGELRAASGDLRGAVEAWKRAMELDADLALDPLAQMTPPQRAVLAQRVKLAEQALAGGPPPPPFWPLQVPAPNQPRGSTTSPVERR